MDDNFLITGYWGEPHVTAENDRGINAAIFGTGRFVLPVGNQFRAEYIGNNTIRMYDGKLLDNGAAAGIPAGMYVDLTIPEAGQSMRRNDIIAFKYKKDTLTLVESGEFVVITGTETSTTAKDPDIYQEDLMSNEATLDYMPLWRVPVSGATIGTPERLYEFRMTGNRIVVAHSDDGINYTAHLHGLGALYNGLEITVIPDKNSVQPAIKLDLNGLGAKNVRMTLPFTSGNSGALAVQDTWFSADAPMTLRYHEKMDMWKSDLQRPSAQSLYGNVPADGVSVDRSLVFEDGEGDELLTSMLFTIFNSLAEKTEQIQQLLGFFRNREKLNITLADDVASRFSFVEHFFYEKIGRVVIVNFSGQLAEPLVNDEKITLATNLPKPTEAIKETIPLAVGNELSRGGRLTLNTSGKLELGNVGVELGADGTRGINFRLVYFWYTPIEVVV